MYRELTVEQAKGSATDLPEWMLVGWDSESERTRM